MALAVSVNGGDRVPVTDVVLYDEGSPIAAAMNHGSVVIYADSIRDPRDLSSILDSLGISAIPAKSSGLTIKGTL